MSDVLVIGSGAGGAPLVWRLCEAGFSVTLLEKGPNYAREDYVHDEAFMCSKGDFFVPSVDTEPHVVIDHARGPGQPKRSTIGWIACCVGGGTVHMGASLYRFHPDDFRMRSLYGPFEHMADWPYGYDELEPYYSVAEHVVGVSGTGGPAHFGARSRPYPMPPLTSHPMVAWFDAACRERGLDPFATPHAINSVAMPERPACAYCDVCSGYGCPIGAKGSTQETFIARALHTGRCELRAHSTATHLLMDSRGRVLGCVCRDGSGAEHAVRANLVVVSCSAIETARLLLLSRSRAFPEGVANSSGLVGQNLQFHAGSAGRGRFARDRHPGRALDNRNPFLVRSVADYYFLPPGVAPIPKGGIHRFDFEQPTPIQFAAELALRGDRPLWGDELVKRLHGAWLEARNLDFEVFHDFIPNARTYVELDPEVRDAWGIPVARIHIDDPPHHGLAGRWLVDRGLELLSDMGADEVRPLSVGYRNIVMIAGTCRAGRDPRASVLNGYCQAHDVPNLFVVDGSFMPTSGGATCTLSIMANSLRTADYILTRARSFEFSRRTAAVGVQ